MHKHLLLCAIAIASLRMEDTDDVIVEDVEESPAKPVEEPVKRVSKQSEESSKQYPSILRKYQNIKEINKHQVLAMESFAVIKEFQDITAASTYVDGNVMLELQRKNDEVGKLANDLQADFRNLTKAEQKRFMEEYKQLLFNTVPQRVRHFKELSANHLNVHHQVMESTIDVLRNDAAHSVLVSYAQSRLKHRQFAAESKLREMLRVQQKKRNLWYFGLTRLEWIMLTSQVWLVGSTLGMLWSLSGAKGGSKGSTRLFSVFDVCLFAMILGLVYVELGKYRIVWSFMKMRVIGMSVVQFILLSMLREARRSVQTYLSAYKRIMRPTGTK